MEYEYAKRGVANAGLTTGIIGTSLGAMSLLGGAGNMLGRLFGGNGNHCCGGDGAPVNRYELSQATRIAELETEVKLRDANFYTIGEIGKLRDYVEHRFEGVNAQLCQQAVVNAQVAANLSCLTNTVNTLSGLTKTVIPNGSICPGWGNVTVTPAAAPTTGA